MQRVLTDLRRCVVSLRRPRPRSAEPQRHVEAGRRVAAAGGVVRRRKGRIQHLSHSRPGRQQPGHGPGLLRGPQRRPGRRRPDPELLRRSFDNGKTWAGTQIVVQQAGMTCGNPCPVVDRTSGTIFLLFCKNPKSKGSTEDVAVFSRRSVWLSRSTDDGADLVGARGLPPR